MKTKIFAIVVMVACVFCHKVVAQDIAVVTLQHGETMKAFYGSNAFKDAVEAAEAGDLVTLSGGTFADVTITKPIKIQGAGYIQDASNCRYRTSINNITINIPEAATGLLLEGLSINDLAINNKGANGYTFKKCSIGSIYLQVPNSGGVIEQCRITWLYIEPRTNELFIDNSIINYISFYNSASNSNTSRFINHCAIGEVNGNIVASFHNSIIRSLGANEYSAYLSNVILSTNNRFSEHNILLDKSEYDALWSDKNNYILTDEAAAKYLGDDGTQVGIYGGENPFNDVPSNPQITSKFISARPNANGKLSVRITVEAQK